MKNILLTTVLSVLASSSMSFAEGVKVGSGTDGLKSDQGRALSNGLVTYQVRDVIVEPTEQDQVVVHGTMDPDVDVRLKFCVFEIQLNKGENLLKWAARTQGAAMLFQSCNSLGKSLIVPGNRNLMIYINNAEFQDTHSLTTARAIYKTAGQSIELSLRKVDASKFEGPILYPDLNVPRELELARTQCLTAIIFYRNWSANDRARIAKDCLSAPKEQLGWKQFEFLRHIRSIGYGRKTAFYVLPGTYQLRSSDGQLIHGIQVD